ncbi:MAG: 3-isopropylmalate dehydratase small subunit [Candidatus Sumerlaea chitinivorans]|uniref:3-isopropylmalate dehydratase small subunit n=1 Tax=Sumerlaea chitinivorans TaxID=2250252 RepID=A0A2Z4Y8V2_SUMC1|nr:3-isopropylmalate dehydratase small subunit [Candidatus Sumerlaea chitinivorans]MCX7963789.1 3-isopropylmalate dehydratase small subunit [Candidatus Sumerlaea chitinivorans]
MAKVVFKVGDDVSTDAIYPGRFMATVLPTETPQYCFADHKEFNEKLNKGEIPPGSVIVAGQNFGCGSSREQAASCLKGWGLIIVARGIARIFLQNAVNLGLQTVIAPEVEAEVGDELEILPDKVVNKTSGKEFAIVPHAPARQAIIDAGGLIPYARKKLLEERGQAA